MVCVFINVRVSLSHSLPHVIIEDPSTPVTHIPNKKDFDVKLLIEIWSMYVDPFSAEYAEACYDERAEMYADSFFDVDIQEEWERHYDAMCSGEPCNIEFEPITINTDIDLPW